MEQFKNAFAEIPDTLGNSLFFAHFASLYARSPSSVAIRTAEAELLSVLPVVSPALDLCCGDGLFASLIRPSGFEVGCDINGAALVAAARKGVHGVLACADITEGIPYPDSYFVLPDTFWIKQNPGP